MRKFRCITIVILNALLGSVTLQAQQIALYSDYIMNGFIINPAVAGSDGFTTIGLSARDHMLGFDYSPKTSVVSMQGRLLRRNYQIRNKSLFNNKGVSKRSGKVGVGAQIFSDKNGYMERTGGLLAYSYHINMGNSQLSLGVAATTFQFRIALEKLKFRDAQNETILNQGFENNVLIPDAHVGSYFLTPNSFLGLSIANLFQSQIKIGSATYDYRIYRTYFLMGGKRINAESELSYEPSFLIKATEKKVFQADLQLRTYYQQDYYLGLSYRTAKSVGILIGAKWNRIHFCYAFDYYLNALQRYSNGAHEINIAIKLGDSARRYRWLIRY